MFITFEGGEGAGKTTQIERLAARLNALGHRDVLVTRQPGGSVLGSALRALVLHPPAGVVVESRTELLIMVADRAQHVAQVIRPHLNAGGIVLCDRYTDSSVAYQGAGRGLDIGEIDSLNDYATAGLAPDLTLLLDLDPTLGLGRQKERTRIEEEAMPFHARVRAGFLTQAARYPGRFAVIDASGLINEVEKEIWACVEPRLPLS